MRLSLFLLMLVFNVLDIGELSLAGDGQQLHPDRTHSSLMERVRRNDQCPDSEYKPWGKDYCCNKCTQGYYKTADCTGEGTRTTCSECKPGTFTQFANYVNKCRSCQQCIAVYFQIELRKCQKNLDRVCGCPSGMYQRKIEGTTFQCKNCTSCKMPLKECSGYNDTICHCEHGQYYNIQNKLCQPCDSCNNGEYCRTRCPPVNVGAEVLVLAITSFTALILIGLGAISYFLYRRFRQKPQSQNHSETGHSCRSELVVGNTRALLPIQEVEFPETMNYATPVPDLPDCVQAAGNKLLPNNTQVNYILADLVPASRWKEFVRRLGMTDHDIERTEMDNRHSFREAQYEMVKVWREKQGGQGATTEAICKVLKEMELNACAEHFQEALQLTRPRAEL